MAEIEKMLDDVIEQEIENLDSITDEEDRAKAIQALAQLHKLRIEEIKAKIEAEEKHRRLEMESERNAADRLNAENALLQQKKDTKIDRFVKIIVSGVELVVPLVCYGIWMGKGFKFEETGSFTSTTFRNLLNRIRPTK